MGICGIVDACAQQLCNLVDSTEQCAKRLHGKSVRTMSHCAGAWHMYLKH